MSLLLNLLWIVLGGGLVLWLEYVLAGLLLCLTIVGIPFGLQCFKIAGLALLPFGRDLGEIPGVETSRTLSLVFNIIWAIVAGAWIFLTHVALGITLALS